MKKTIMTAALCLGLLATAHAATIYVSSDTSANYTVDSTNNVQGAAKNETITGYGTITDTGYMELTVADLTVGVQYSNVYFYGTNGVSGNNVAHSVCPNSVTGTYKTPTIAGANIKILGDYSVRQIDLSDSNVSITDGASLTSYYTGTTTLGALTVAAGGKTVVGSGTTLNYEGSITLSLAEETGLTTYDSSSKTLTTSALAGVMKSGSSLTLNLAGVDALSSFNAGDSFSLVLSGLTNSGLNTATAFSATGWDVEYDTTGASGATTLTLTKAIPEPATATLSLLALAGLAARRRRK